MILGITVKAVFKRKREKFEFSPLVWGKKTELYMTYPLPFH